MKRKNKSSALTTELSEPATPGPLAAIAPFSTLNKMSNIECILNIIRQNEDKNPTWIKLFSADFHGDWVFTTGENE